MIFCSEARTEISDADVNWIELACVRACLNDNVEILGSVKILTYVPARKALCTGKPVVKIS
jgi:hypothetical protein